ncbi:MULTISPECIES: DegT/DnrJ/EryC1/StrS aminotransferase family protein [unclassified Wenzhouxiangella]|uniref:DegT/DnrJ/EryC1/StrS family aminotransferase n=1 Tax=unclassified Wenzhouxiangella TaxID=2613841 RepID=UPI000E32501A|nr:MULTISPECIES: DegT/DnrJ/EryC1/StrS family aminotransferase [unclassified Wenzhouxiangella]RFF26301.1 DegT/DnrJ/EryC1/StrS family aminotransferase [Wenzhouxiangella sp. 15181]RFP67428.1 DegT/DnrJ/EryC1/StrS family aminotransferase [Wenzhouxiangella sp. 15190]
MKPIPMVDLGAQHERLKPQLEAAIAEVMAGTRYILGPNVQALEEELGEYLGVRHALSCASGTDALHLALRAAGIGPGDEVITSPFTFIATAEAICYCGADPVFVDIDSRTFNIDPAGVAAAVTEHTKAILPVHLFGQPADMPALQSIADEHDLAIIEDCAQSFGATIDGRQTGAFGLAGAFSFFPSKNLGACGDAGLVATSDDALAEELRMLRNHGRRVDGYEHKVVGYNSRLDEIQAAILRVKLPLVDEFNRQRRRVAKSYRECLSETVLTLPLENDRGRHVYHQFTTLVPEGRREAIQAALKQAGIASAVYYPTPLHRQPAFSRYTRGGSLANSEAVAERCLSLPIFPEMTEAQIERVAESVKCEV